MSKGVYKRTEKHKKHWYKPKKRVTFKCKDCGVEFQDKPSTKRVYCSRKCQDLNRQTGSEHWHWKGGEKEYQCSLCKKSFKRKPSNIVSKEVFCGHKCAGIWRKKHQKNTNTNIEIKMAEILDRYNIKYIQQVVYPKICIADFYLPEHNLVIFCDGEYWHNYPNGKKRDKQQVIALEKLGFKAIRLWGKEILEEDKEKIKYLIRYIK